MQFELNKTTEILKRTPIVLETMLLDLSEEWIYSNEGPETWSPFDIIGHLIYGEKTDWIPRMNIILSRNTDPVFEPFDRFAQFNESKGNTIHSLLAEFKLLREENINYLLSKQLTEAELSLKGIHPALGEVTLRELLATWVAHDLNHISQISRVLAEQYKTEVGPWIEYLKFLKD